MKQKTAMMELIEKLYLRLNYHLESLSPSPEIIELIIKDATQLLEKEKEQIMDAYKKSTSQFSLDSRIDYPKSAEQYYNETYKHEA